MAICDVISKLKTPTEIYVEGYAYSMGALILMTGFKNPNVTRKCHKFATALVHGGSNQLSGSKSQIKDMNKFFDRYEKLIDEYILENSKITRELYDQMERYEWFMTSDEMLEHGLVDEIV